MLMLTILNNTNGTYITNNRSPPLVPDRDEVAGLLGKRSEVKWSEKKWSEVKSREVYLVNKIKVKWSEVN